MVIMCPRSTHKKIHDIQFDERLRTNFIIPVFVKLFRVISSTLLHPSVTHSLLRSFKHTFWMFHHKYPQFNIALSVFRLSLETARLQYTNPEHQLFYKIIYHKSEGLVDSQLSRCHNLTLSRSCEAISLSRNFQARFPSISFRISIRLALHFFLVFGENLISIFVPC